MFNLPLWKQQQVDDVSEKEGDGEELVSSEDRKLTTIPENRIMLHMAASIAFAMVLVFGIGYFATNLQESYDSRTQAQREGLATSVVYEGESFIPAGSAHLGADEDAVGGAYMSF